MEQPALEELAKKRPNFHVIFADSVKQWIVAADSISIWMSTAIAEVYMAGKSCHILRPVPIEHEYDPVIYKDAHYVTCYDEFAAAMAEPEPPFPIAKDVIEGYFDPGETPAYKRMADLLEDVYKNPAGRADGRRLYAALQQAEILRAGGGTLPLPPRLGAEEALCLLPAAGQFCPTHLRLRGQGACDAGAGRGDGSKGSSRL